MDNLMFGEWLPDVPDFQNPGCVLAQNVIPIPGGYGPQPDLLATGQTTSGACMGARLLFQADGTDVIVGGTLNRLFINVNGTTTATAGMTALAASDAWDFAQYNDFVIATSINNDPQYLTDIDTDTGWSTLPGSPPRAKHCARVEDFLMLGNLDGLTNRIQWSAFNSPAGSWTPARLTQAGYADMPRHLGAVQRIVGGRYPMVMQERGISRLEYIGPPSVWRATEIEQARGVLAPFSVVTVGFVTYYLAQDGFWSTDGNSFQPIGAQRVDEWFFDEASSANIREVHGTIDFQNKCVVWAFKTSELFNRLLRYSWSENRWSTSNVSVARLVEASTDGLTLEQLGALYATLEDVPVSLDDPRWLGRNRVLAAYVDGASTTELYTAVGAVLQADIEGPDFQPIPGRRSLVSSARMLGGGSGTWLIASIAKQNDRTNVKSTYRAAGAAGSVPLRGEGMIMRIACRAPAGAVWESAQGVQLNMRPSGKR